MSRILSDFTVDELLRLNRLLTLGQLVRGAAHNLNNSLQAIAGAAELLSNRSDLPEPAARMIGRIANQSAKATTVVNDLVTLTRSEDGGDRADLRDVVARAVGLRQHALSRSQIRLTQHEDSGLASALVRGNAPLLQLAILNVLLNAEQALAGRANGEIQLTVEPAEAAIRLMVADNGPGVPVDLHERIFEPFFSTGAAGAAAGLGLPVARSIVESTGGTLRLDISGDGPGATFVVALPTIPP